MNTLETLKGVGGKVDRLWHEKRLDWAIFWGRIPWVVEEIRHLKLDEYSAREKLVSALMRAASRADIIYGDSEKANTYFQVGIHFLNSEIKNPNGASLNQPPSHS